MTGDDDRVPAAIAGLEQAVLGSLRQSYPGWHISPGPFGGWRAEWRSPDALRIRYIGDQTLEGLGRRLEVIEAARGESES